MKTSTAATAEAPFHPSNRKYLGSKRILRRWICSAIRAAAGTPASFLDGFCGTGAVALEMSREGAGEVTAVDSLESNCVILRGFVAAAHGFPELGRIGDIICALNALAPEAGYVTGNFAGTYFTEENCMRMDVVRRRIAELRHTQEVSAPAADYLLASFLLAADRVALEVMGLPPHAVGYLQYASQLGVGQFDLSQIDIRGEKPESVRRVFRLHDTVERQLRWLREA